MEIKIFVKSKQMSGDLEIKIFFTVRGEKISGENRGKISGKTYRKSTIIRIKLTLTNYREKGRF